MLADLLPQRLILDRYRIGNRIGAGASGTVYAADDVKQSSQVVIKLFDGASDGFSAWNDEMRLIMRLSHPNIVPCFDVGFDDQLKVWMLVLAYQEGGSLRRWMSDPALRRQIPAKQVLSDIASALLFAHKKGVIHRDVKPDNVLAERKGVPTRFLLGDFGAGRFLSSGRVASSPAGSVLYMAPEVREGAATASADQYSLGVMGIELLTLEHPSEELIRRFCQQHLGQPSLAGLVARLVNPKPEARYPSLAEFLFCVDQLEPSMSTCTSEERLLLEYLQQRHGLRMEQAEQHHRAWQNLDSDGKRAPRPFADFLVEKQLLDRVTAKTLKAMRMGYLSASDAEMRSTLGLTAAPETKMVQAPQVEKQESPVVPKEAPVLPRDTPGAKAEVAVPAAQSRSAIPDVSIPLVRSDAEIPAIEIVASTSQDTKALRAEHVPENRPSPDHPESSRLQVGQSLGRYDLEEVLGEGSTAVIYRSYHKLLQMPVAIKRFKPAVLSRRMGSRERIVQEGRLMVRMDHPNIVRVLDIDESDGVPYIVFEYVSELSLQALIDNIGRLSSERLAQIGAQVAAALSAASSAGLLHRDVKPENILVRKDGLIKLADFGIATYLLPDGTTVDELARAGLISGTPQYISPEQISTPAQIDFRADIYSLGATLYHAATGHPPFDFSTLDELLNAHLAMAPLPLASLVPGIDAELAQLIAQMMQKRPEDRPQSLTELSEKFERIADRVLHSESVHRKNVIATQSSSHPVIAVDGAASTQVGRAVESTVVHEEKPSLKNRNSAPFVVDLSVLWGRNIAIPLILLVCVLGIALVLWFAVVR
ncbi:MAG TPA: serine/threonine-protein kinase [Pseudomonadota bacterium]|nr:serine/threonine-protein kinase [Pseudomonadota bacterium]